MRKAGSKAQDNQAPSHSTSNFARSPLKRRAYSLGSHLGRCQVMAPHCIYRETHDLGVQEAESLNQIKR